MDKTPEQIADERAWDAIKRVRAHFAAHLDVAREDGNAERERGARALLEDLDVLRVRVEYGADRIEAAIEADRAQRPTFTFSDMDRMMAAWESYYGDVSAFYDAWVAHINEGVDLPDWMDA